MSEKLKLFLKGDSVLNGLPEHDYLFSVADSAASVLENEICSYRPAADFGSGAGDPALPALYSAESAAKEGAGRQEDI